MRHFSVAKEGYEEIPDDDEDSSSPFDKKHQHHHHHRSKNQSRARSTFLVLGTLILLTVIWASNSAKAFLRSSKQIASAVPVHKETVPTVLSIVDPETNEFVYALDNPVYEILKNSKFHQVAEQLEGVEYPEIFLDLEHTEEVLEEEYDYDDDDDDEQDEKPVTVQKEQTSLTVSWLTGKDVNGEEMVSENDLLVLYCADRKDDLLIDDDDNTQATIVEAATVAQVRATQLRNNFATTEFFENEWYIPKLPSAFLARHPYCQFRLYQQQQQQQQVDQKEYYIIAKSSVISFLSAVNKPVNIHLSLTTSPDSMVVQFVTAASGTPVAQVNGLRNKKFEGTTDTYQAKDLCQAPANQTEPGKFQSPGYLHTVKLTNLTPNTVYHYQVGLATGQGVTWSSTYTFTTALPPGDKTEHSYLVYGDQGCPSLGWGDGGAWVAAMAARESDTIRSIHHFGDLSYAQGAAHQWDNWFDMIQPVSTTVPLMIAIGNHEYDHESGGTNKDPSGIQSDSGFMPPWGNFGNDSGGECGVPTAKRFKMPDTGNGVFWYSYDYGLVHTVVLSSEHDLSAGSVQHEWLRNDLKHVDRAVTPWVIVETHRPLYEGEIFIENYSVGVAMRYEMEDLLYDYRVDVVLAGHYHAYHRTCDGLYRAKCNHGGPIHFTIGSAGARLDNSDVEIFTNHWTENVILQTYGYGRITVKNETSLHFEFVKAGNESDPTSGDVLDSVWITRKR